MCFGSALVSAIGGYNIDPYMGYAWSKAHILKAYVDKFEGMACPRWEQPSGCAIRLLREGKAEGVSANTTADNITEWDGNASTFQLTCNACALTVANDPYERSNIESIDSETGVAETAGGYCQKQGQGGGVKMQLIESTSCVKSLALARILTF